MADKERRSAGDFETLDNYLTTLDRREEFQAVAIKEVLAWQIEAAMKNKPFQKMAGACHKAALMVNRLSNHGRRRRLRTTCNTRPQMIRRKVRPSSTS